MSVLATEHRAINLSQGFPNFEIDPVAITIAGWPIHWYGLMYAANFFIFLYTSWWLYQRYFKTQPQISWKTWENLVFGGFLAGVVGGRLGFMLFYNPGVWLADPLAVERVGRIIVELQFAFALYEQALAVDRIAESIDDTTFPRQMGTQ